MGFISRDWLENSAVTLAVCSAAVSYISIFTWRCAWKKGTTICWKMSYQYIRAWHDLNKECFVMPAYTLMLPASHLLILITQQASNAQSLGTPPNVDFAVSNTHTDLAFILIHHSIALAFTATAYWPSSVCFLWCGFRWLPTYRHQLGNSCHACYEFLAAQ